MIKAVIFDLDDTLISEEEYVRSGYKHISRILAKDFNLKEEKIFEELWALFLKDPKLVFNRLLDKYRFSYDKAYIFNLVDEYRGHLPEIDFFPDVLPLLRKLKGKNIKTGIITDGFAISQRQKLKVLNASDYFDEIIVTDELGKGYWKPNPRAFEIIAKKLDLSFTEMLYVGDNPQKDFYISNIYPIGTVRISRNQGGFYKNGDYLEGIKENFIIENLMEINQTIIN